MGQQSFGNRELALRGRLHRANVRPTGQEIHEDAAVCWDDRGLAPEGFLLYRLHRGGTGAFKLTRARIIDLSRSAHGLQVLSS